jgi:hypothetical protein
MSYGPLAIGKLDKDETIQCFDQKSDEGQASLVKLNVMNVACGLELSG